MKTHLRLVTTQWGKPEKPEKEKKFPELLDELFAKLEEKNGYDATLIIYRQYLNLLIEQIDSKLGDI